jgi:hypothetical protein
MFSRLNMCNVLITCFTRVVPTSEHGCNIDRIPVEVSSKHQPDAPSPLDHIESSYHVDSNDMQLANAVLGTGEILLN